MEHIAGQYSQGTSARPRHFRERSVEIRRTSRLDELKLQPNGGRGLTLIDVDAKDALVSVAAFAQVLQVLGTALRGGKPREEVLKGAALAAHVGKRARKGKAVEGMKAQRVLAAP